MGSAIASRDMGSPKRRPLRRKLDERALRILRHEERARSIWTRRGTSTSTPSPQVILRTKASGGCCVHDMASDCCIERLPPRDGFPEFVEVGRTVAATEPGERSLMGSLSKPEFPQGREVVANRWTAAAGRPTV